ncbi:hypothetical protein [Microbacterium sp.]|uniref:hypothetical protein n=1 Tax=Microbacterium sp. TaxID=51671 RepID=UPI0031FE5706|nr:hypothetical protein [Microbacterium sp.]
MDFSMDGDPHHLSMEEIERAVEDQKPEPIQQLAVAVADQWWPVKQVFGRALGLPNTKFNSRKAFDVFRRLGLPVHDVKRDGPLPSSTDRTESSGRVDNLRLRSLELAVAVSAPRGDTNDLIVATAERFLAWLRTEK